jgi:cytochrome c oxidase assembly protein subunit 11
VKLTNTRLAITAAAACTAMLGLAFAADPLYDTFCRMTGYGGTTRVAVKAPDQVLDQSVTVRFDANVADSPVRFRPLQADQVVKLGQHGLAFYEVTNDSAAPAAVIASYNVTPHFAGAYFNKLECFCFTERVVQPGETKKLPVVYFVSPDMAEDKVAGQLETLTLSYTFFNAKDYKGPREEASTGAAFLAAGAPRR